MFVVYRHYIVLRTVFNPVVATPSKFYGIYQISSEFDNFKTNIPDTCTIETQGK